MNNKEFDIFDLGSYSLKRLPEYCEKLLQYIVQGHDINIKNYNYCKNTILHLACSYNYMPVINVLLENGADINIKNDDGNTSLHIACNFDLYDIALKLIEAGADVNLVNNNNNTPLHLACHRNHEKTTSLLIKSGSDLNIKNIDGNTPLHVCLLTDCISDETQIIKNLVANHADIHQLNNNKESPLYLACHENHLEIVQLLLNSGANPNTETLDGRTPLYTALSRNFKQLALYLAKSGVELNTLSSKGYTAAQYFAIYFSEDEFLNLSSHYIDFSIKNCHKNNIFHIAAINGLSQIFQLGINNPQFHKDVFETNKNNQTPLDLAIQNNQPTMIALITSFQEYIELKKSNSLTQPSTIKKLKL